MNTYLSFTVLAVTDLNNLPVASISTFNALRDYDVIPDTFAEGLIRDVVGYPSFPIPQDALPADSYVGDQGRSSLRAFTVYFNSGRTIILLFT